MKTLVLASQKGGVGNSTVATLLAQSLRRQGQRVLLWELEQTAARDSWVEIEPTLRCIASIFATTAPEQSHAVRAGRPDAPTSDADANGATADLFGQDLLPGLDEGFRGAEQHFEQHANPSPDVAATITAASTDAPMQLPVHTIDEDPQQPRKEFDSDARNSWPTPSSSAVCASLCRCGHILTNAGAGCRTFGSLRLRASKLAGRADLLQRL